MGILFEKLELPYTPTQAKVKKNNIFNLKIVNIQI